MRTRNLNNHFKNSKSSRKALDDSNLKSMLIECSESRINQVPLSVNSQDLKKYNLELRNKPTESEKIIYNTPMIPREKTNPSNLSSLKMAIKSRRAVSLGANLR